MLASFSQSVKWGQEHLPQCRGSPSGGLLCTKGALSAWPAPAASPLALPSAANMPAVPSVPLLAASGGTLPSGNSFLCHFLMELQVALKSAWPFRGREVRAVQGM